MLLFFLSAAITFSLYTVWGLMEIATAPVSPYLTEVSIEAVAAPSGAVKAGFWDTWPRGVKGQFPPCETNVLALGLDEILQATVDTYCGLDPGSYESRINPAVMDLYEARADSYPDGMNSILLLPELGVGFTTAFKDGKPVFDVILMADGKSIKSAEEDHPLNPQTCFNCHDGFDGACQGYVCGNRPD